MIVYLKILNIFFPKAFLKRRKRTSATKKVNKTNKQMVSTKYEENEEKTRFFIDGQVLLNFFFLLLHGWLSYMY